MTFRPMLAGEADLDRLQFPLFASTKLDGVRAIVREGAVYSRNNKLIPNQYVQAKFKDLENYDGELILGDPADKLCYNKTVSAVMSQSSPEGANVVFHAFDHLGLQFAPYQVRYASLASRLGVEVLPQLFINNLARLLELEETTLAHGHEGLILRGIASPYKQGRSTTREGYLLKLKRFKDAEFKVVGFEERMHNSNEATVNELGRTSRSSHQANMVPRGDLGALICKYGDTTFNVGTGFDDAQRKFLWLTRDELIGKIAKVKYFAVGMKDLPRHPVFLGFREGD